MSVMVHQPQQFVVLFKLLLVVVRPCVFLFIMLLVLPSALAPRLSRVSSTSSQRTHSLAGSPAM